MPGQAEAGSWQTSLPASSQRIISGIQHHCGGHNRPEMVPARRSRCYQTSFRGVERRAIRRSLSRTIRHLTYQASFVRTWLYSQDTATCGLSSGTMWVSRAERPPCHPPLPANLRGPFPDHPPPPPPPPVFNEKLPPEVCMSRPAGSRRRFHRLYVEL